MLKYVLCPELPMIYHTHGNTNALYELDQIGELHERTCENYLLLDKIKNPSDMTELWQLTGSKALDFKDFSPVFMNEGRFGWTFFLYEHYFTAYNVLTSSFVVVAWISIAFACRKISGRTKIGLNTPLGSLS